MQLLFAGLHFDFEVDARGTVELRHDDALGTVHDELAAAEHDRDVAEVDVLFDRLLLLEAHADLQTHRVGALQEAALRLGELRLREFVTEVDELRGLVEGFDREGFPDHGFETGSPHVPTTARRPAGTPRTT
jgi:hypothetical protein